MADDDAEATAPLDKKAETRSSRSYSDWSRPPWQLRDTDTSNHDLPLPSPEHKEFAEEALKQVLIAVVILSAIVAAVNRLHLSLGWTVAAVGAHTGCYRTRTADAPTGIAAFSIRARVDTLRETFHAEVERKRAEGNVDHAESVECVAAMSIARRPLETARRWLNSFMRVLWPLIDPSLFVTLLDMYGALDPSDES
jgi:hypothetical protein